MSILGTSEKQSGKKQKTYSKGDKQNQAYAFIRNAILSNKFLPNYPLTETNLITLLNDMSRTPIRDALMRLEHEGLIQRIPNKGLFVTQVNVRDLLMISEIRLPLECTAIRLFVERADEELHNTLKNVIAQHQKCFAAGDYFKAIQCDNDFHYAIAKGSMNDRLFNIIFSLLEENSRGAFLTASDSTRIERSISQHQEVVSAIEKNDADLAASLLSQHLTDWVEYMKQMQFKNFYLYQ